ncbi:unnamed protein product [Urochloa humidicola]
MAPAPALAAILLAVLATAAVVGVHAEHAPTPSPEASPSEAPDDTEVETKWRRSPGEEAAAPYDANAPGAVSGDPEEEDDDPDIAPGPDAASLDDDDDDDGGDGDPNDDDYDDEEGGAPTMAPALSPFESGESPEEDEAAESESAGPIASPPLEGAPALAPFGISGEAPEEEGPAGAPEEAASPSSSEEMAAAPSPEDYDVLNEEALAPDGASSGGVGTEESPAAKAAVSKAPAPAPSSDDADSGASASVPTRRSIVAAFVFAAVLAVAAS